MIWLGVGLLIAWFCRHLIATVLPYMFAFLTFMIVAYFLGWWAAFALAVAIGVWSWRQQTTKTGENG